MKFFLSDGSVVLINAKDKRLLAGRKWYRHGRYVRSGEPRIYLHQLILGTRGVDHKNGDGLDNRRQNLRRCKQKYNCWNSKKKRDYKQFKGVYFDRRRGLWWAQLYANRQSHFGGYHFTEKAAAVAYNRLARKHHGRFALMNVIDRI